MPVPVAYLITELSIGGAQSALLRLLTHLDRDRFLPVVACLYNGDGEIAQAIRGLGIRVFDARMRRRSDLFALWRLYHWLGRTRPLILHTSLFHANLSGRILARLVGIPNVICSERTMEMESEWRYRVNRWTIGLVTRIACVSVNVRDFCADYIGLPADRLVVIPNGVETAKLPAASSQQVRTELGLPQDGVVIGAVSRLDPVKGIDVLLQAFSYLDGPSLVVVGDGPERLALKQLAQDLGVAGQILWTGRRSDVQRLLSAFDLFVQASLYEGMPNAVLEAMAAGLPVVATAVGGTSEVVVDGTTGLLVPPSDPSAIAQAIACLLGDGAARSTLGNNGRQRVEQYFSVDQMVYRTEALYEELLDKRRQWPAG